jgi:hypothetical protein
MRRLPFSGVHNVRSTWDGLGWTPPVLSVPSAWNVVGWCKPAWELHSTHWQEDPFSRLNQCSLR